MCAYSMSVILERVGSICTTFVYMWWLVKHLCKWDWLLEIAGNVERVC